MDNPYHNPEVENPAAEAHEILDALAQRRTVRAYTPAPIDRETIDSIISDGLNAPTSCNHQMWHFVVVCEQHAKEQLQRLSGSNEHFTTSGAIIILCFHMGWNHNKFAVVQSIAAAAYHMSISAHLRGLGASWNAGIGNGEKVKQLLGIPAQFEVVGALCLGRRADDAPDLRPPRRPLEAVRSYEGFDRPDDQIYPLRGGEPFRYWNMQNHRHRHGVFCPDEWGWNRIADFRGYAVYAKSPLPGVYVSRRLGREMPVEVSLMDAGVSGAEILEIMPFGGSYTVLLANRLGADSRLHVAELSQNNIDFTRQRVQRETMSSSRVSYHLFCEGHLPFPDESLDCVFLPQILEMVPGWVDFIDEIHRVLRPDGRLALTFRNALSWFGVYFLWTGRRCQVPNFGPYRPMNPLAIHRQLKKRFTMDLHFGISDSPATIGISREGLKGRFCRLDASRWRKR